MTKWDLLHELINQAPNVRNPTPYWVTLLGGLLFVLALWAIMSAFRRPRVYSPTRIVHKAPEAPQPALTWDEEDTESHDVAGGGERQGSARVPDSA